MERCPTHQRKSPRLEGYDYSQAGGYFITIVTHNRVSLFGEICDGSIRLNDFGKTVHDEWEKLIISYPHVIFDEWILMPNHFHGILFLTEEEKVRRKAGNQDQRKPTLGAIIGLFKSVSTKRINQLRETPTATVWQRNYYDHIIRNEKDLECIREYIIANPSRWENDNENVQFEYTT